MYVSSSSNERSGQTVRGDLTDLDSEDDKKICQDDKRDCDQDDDDDDDDGDGGDDDDGVGDGDDGDDELSSVPRDVGYMEGYEKYGYEQEHHQDHHHHHHHHHHYLSHQNRVVIHVGYPVITSASFVFIASPVVINVDLLRFIAICSIIPGIMIAFLTVIKLSIIRTIVTVICPFIFYTGNNITIGPLACSF